VTVVALIPAVTRSSEGLWRCRRVVSCGRRVACVWRAPAMLGPPRTWSLSNRRPSPWPSRPACGRRGRRRVVTLTGRPADRTTRSCSTLHGGCWRSPRIEGSRGGGCGGSVRRFTKVEAGSR
jgi:hypothetical protein